MNVSLDNLQVHIEGMAVIKIIRNVNLKIGVHLVIIVSGLWNNLDDLECSNR